MGDVSSGFWDAQTSGDELRARQVQKIRDNAFASPQKRQGDETSTPASPQEGEMTCHMHTDRGVGVGDIALLCISMLSCYMLHGSTYSHGVSSE